MTDGEALAYVHAAYPDASEEIGACREIERGMLEGILIGLLGKGKITSAHAARLLRRDRADVMRSKCSHGLGPRGGAPAGRAADGSEHPPDLG